MLSVRIILLRGGGFWTNSLIFVEICVNVSFIRIELLLCSSAHLFFDRWNSRKVYTLPWMAYWVPTAVSVRSEVSWLCLVSSAVLAAAFAAALRWWAIVGADGTNTDRWPAGISFRNCSLYPISEICPGIRRLTHLITQGIELTEVFRIHQMLISISPISYWWNSEWRRYPISPLYHSSEFKRN